MLAEDPRPYRPHTVSHPAIEKDRGSLGNPEDSPAQRFKEGGESVLSGRLPSAGSTSQDQPPGLDSGTLHLAILEEQTVHAVAV